MPAAVVDLTNVIVSLTPFILGGGLWGGISIVRKLRPEVNAIKAQTEKTSLEGAIELNEALREDNKTLRDHVEKQDVKIENLEAEVAGLRGEVKKLTDALAEAVRNR